MRAATNPEGTAMILLRQAKMFCCPSRKRKFFSWKTPITVTGTSPTRRCLPTMSPVGKKTLAASEPRMTTGAPAAKSWAEKSRPSSTS